VIDPPGRLAAVEHGRGLGAAVPPLPTGAPDDAQRRCFGALGPTAAAAGGEPGQDEQEKCLRAASFTKGLIGRR
jgi:hypothetical protein